MVLVLLPPSEGKSKTDQMTGSNSKGPATILDIDSLSMPELSVARHRVARTLSQTCQAGLNSPRRLSKLRKELGISASQDEEVVLNTHLFDSQTRPASEVYSGVLFAAAGFDGLTSPQRRRASKRVLISSALFGWVTLDDAIVAYRLSAGSTLPRLGSMKSFWKTQLKDPTAAAIGDGAYAKGLIVDLRSGSYVSMWPLPRECDDRAISVKVWQLGPDGTKTAVTHFNKEAKGHVARSLSVVTGEPSTFDELADICIGAGFKARVNLDGRPRLDIII